MDKSYQTSDWRIRPLPQQMIEYAKMDSCVLVWICFILLAKHKKSDLMPAIYLECHKMTYQKIHPRLGPQIILEFDA